MRDVPDDVHAELRQRAAAARMSLSEFTLGELTRLARRPTLADLLDRVAASAVEPLSFEQAREDVARQAIGGTAGAVGAVGHDLRTPGTRSGR